MMLSSFGSLATSVLLLLAVATAAPSPDGSLSARKETALNKSITEHPSTSLYDNSQLFEQRSIEEDESSDERNATPSLRSKDDKKTDKKPKRTTVKTPLAKVSPARDDDVDGKATKSTKSTKSIKSTKPTKSTKSTGSVPDGTWPASKGSVLYSAPYVIKAGQVFDGQMKTYERSNVKCSGGEGQKDTAVFIVEAGGTLKNAIIGKNQKEGVHCDQHECKIDNVWWDDVCEDALSIKGGSASSVTTITNCGARHAEDKVVQHNGQGTVKIIGFFAQDFGKLYRSCGTCGNIARKVIMENVYALDPLVSVVTVNKNYNDQAILKNIHVKTTTSRSSVKVCQWSQGGSKPSNLGDGPSGTLCQYTTSDVHINER